MSNQPNSGNIIVKPSEVTEGFDKTSMSDAELFGFVTRKELHKPFTGRIGRIEMFPDNIYDLQVEASHHLDLSLYMQQVDDSDFYIRLANIAAFLGILLDGDYSKEDLERLVDIMIRKLRDRRTIVV